MRSEIERIKSSAVVDIWTKTLKVKFAPERSSRGVNGKTLILRRLVSLHRSVIESVLDYSKAYHPKEGILLLRGKVTKDSISVDEVEIPPRAVHGYSFSNFPLHMLPIDFSVVGTAHSHPSGVLRPSAGDLDNYYGRIMVIVAYPYSSEQNIAIFDSKGNPIGYEVIEDHRPNNG